MCDIVTAAIVAGITTVASTTANVIAQTKAAKAQTKAINEQRAVVREETRQEATGQLFDQMRAARREQASIRTAGGEAGLWRRTMNTVSSFIKSNSLTPASGLFNTIGFIGHDFFRNGAARRWAGRCVPAPCYPLRRPSARLVRAV